VLNSLCRSAPSSCSHRRGIPSLGSFLWPSSGCAPTGPCLSCTEESTSGRSTPVRSHQRGAEGQGQHLPEVSDISPQLRAGGCRPSRAEGASRGRGSAAEPRGGGRCGERRQSPPGSCPRGAAAPPRTWARPAEGGRAEPVLCGAARRREHGPGRRGPGALSGAMRGRLLARLRRRRLLRLLLALGALALGLWAAYLELLAAAAGPGGGAGPDRSKYHPSRYVPSSSLCPVPGPEPGFAPRERGRCRDFASPSALFGGLSRRGTRLGLRSPMGGLEAGALSIALTGRRRYVCMYRRRQRAPGRCALLAWKRCAWCELGGVQQGGDWVRADPFPLSFSFSLFPFPFSFSVFLPFSFFPFPFPFFFFPFPSAFKGRCVFLYKHGYSIRAVCLFMFVCYTQRAVLNSPWLWVLFPKYRQ